MSFVKHAFPFVYVSNHALGGLRKLVISIITTINHSITGYRIEQISNSMNTSLTRTIT